MCQTGLIRAGVISQIKSNLFAINKVHDKQFIKITFHLAGQTGDIKNKPKRTIKTNCNVHANTIIEPATGHKATKTRRESNYPTIKNFFRLTVLSCFLKAFTDEAVTTVSLNIEVLE